MNSVEKHSADWREIRARADSIATAVFLIAGGALSLSITVIVGNLGSGLITPKVVSLATEAWYYLLASIILFLLLKFHLILQAYLGQFCPDWINKHLKLSNRTGWTIGLAGFATFVWGMTQMVRAAATAVGAN